MQSARDHQRIAILCWMYISYSSYALNIPGYLRLTLHIICNIIAVQGGDTMDTNMTFRMDSEVKAQMAAICTQLGMTTSTAFNIFANAFVRAKGMPFSVTIQEPDRKLTKEQMLADTDQMLADFAADYQRMAE